MSSFNSFGLLIDCSVDPGVLWLKVRIFGGLPCPFVIHLPQQATDLSGWMDYVWIQLPHKMADASLRVGGLFYDLVICSLEKTLH